MEDGAVFWIYLMSIRDTMIRRSAPIDDTVIHVDLRCVRKKKPTGPWWVGMPMMHALT